MAEENQSQIESRHYLLGVTKLDYQEQIIDGQGIHTDPSVQPLFGIPETHNITEHLSAISSINRHLLAFEVVLQ